MKNLFIFCILSFLCAAFPLNAQVSIGMRDSHHAYITYSFEDHYSVKFEQSIYAEKLPCQSFRIYAGYNFTHQNLNFGVRPFFGRTYNSNFWETGALLDLRYDIAKSVIYGILNPLYNSIFNYKTCFTCGCRVNIQNPLSLVAEYTTIPEYTMSEKRVRCGLAFKFNKFEFSPLASIPVSGYGKAKSLRINFSFNYQF